MAVGDLVGTFSVAGDPYVNFTLATNPNGYFALVQGELLSAVDTIPTGTYSIEIMAIGPDIAALQTFVLQNNSSPLTGDIRVTDDGSIRVTDDGSIRTFNP